MACFMCGSGIHDEDSYLKKMKGMGMEVEGGNILKKIKKGSKQVGRKTTAASKQVGRKTTAASKQVGRKARRPAGNMIEQAPSELVGFAAGSAVGSATGNPIAGAVAGKAASEGFKKTKTGKKLRKKSGLGMHDSETESESDDEQPKKGKGMRRSSAWIEHVKSVASKKKIPYGEALKIASKTYKKN